MTESADGPWARLGLAVPVVQAPIGSAATPELAAAVSNAGGLGMLALSWTDLDEVGKRVHRTAELTARPFGINLVLEWPQHDRLSACLAEGVAVVSTFWGDPAPYTAAIHRAHAVHVHTVGSAEEARQAVDVGVDVVVAQGWEAGGHVTGQVATLALVPAVVDAVGSVPVLAAGGIADGRGVAAVLALGAQAAWIGTRFLLAHEAGVADHYRQRLIGAAETDTVHGEVFDLGWPAAPHRVLRSSTTDAWDEAGRPVGPGRPGEGDVVGSRPDGAPVVRYSVAMPVASTTGDVEAMAMYAGQGTALVRRRQSAAEIVHELAAGLADATRRLGATVS